ncbi:hypothetical protein RHGRI_034269 [Rhododendron griersonianum]|uniref:MADS-box domain-containing protein n=1 Tax=Rhododendron griersonianum TaxID=479676 RepID=A0AAV6HZY9_9ERIC|nr:hypothetical protein RHGRI_034269 [Rhododendron griersonianum]
MKNASDLSVLCDVDIGLFIFSGHGRPFEFCSSDRQNSSTFVVANAVLERRRSIIAPICVRKAVRAGVIEMSGVCAASDIWSVGYTMIELLTCVPPYYDLQLFQIVQVKLQTQLNHQKRVVALKNLFHSLMTDSSKVITSIFAGNPIGNLPDHLLIEIFIRVPMLEWVR